ncbi:1-acyl-sn-glycerol-3-phosphate acyltransferase [Gordonia lacunae]|uniref:Glycerol acyltransferase n=1 Tax=Gordonia lacunae TaxID=417102 RepID=A0A243QCH2_9ACTN|nr:1-acyl-sn-glycerol-3-phosphate acyltransferase [Gordonia lacunae]OUC79389.1 glycerol acyltransferase [Gordonia lacunae]
MDERARRLVDLTVAVGRLYHRISAEQRAPMPAGPVLFVANHGFGGVFDLNVLAFASAYDRIGDRRRVAILTHQIAWTLGVGPILEKFDAVPASHGAGLRALRSGNHALVFPGGDIDGFKSWTDRNKVLFAGRTGFAKLAMVADVPIVPVVTAGAGESLVVLGAGRRLARLAGLGRLLRLKSFPLTVSLPWGINAGLVGLLPYLPFPTKLTTTILPPMRPNHGESVDHYASRVHSAMEDELTALTAGRVPVIG